MASQSFMIKDFVVSKKLFSSAQSHIQRTGCLGFPLLRSKLSPPELAVKQATVSTILLPIDDSHMGAGDDLHLAVAQPHFEHQPEDGCTVCCLTLHLVEAAQKVKVIARHG